VNMRIRYLSVILALLFLTVLVGCAPTAQAPAVGVTVIRVIDGDTIEVSLAGAIYDVRYIGIDTPEFGEPWADEATELNKELVEGETVWLEKDVSETDKYGRLLRYVYVGDTFVNAELVKQGLAWAKAYEPDTKNQDSFEELEAKAKQDKIGIWAVVGE
jgi:micrococcal nuclease